MALSHAIMTALLEEELSGYDLARRFQTSLGFFWAASHQQIYQELRKLAEGGLLEATAVAQDGRPDKIVYALTAAGHAELEDWLHSESRRKPAKDDLFVKLYNVGHGDPAPILEELRARRAEHAEKLALYERIRARHYADPLALPVSRRGIYLALDAGLRYERMFLEWCDDALALLAPEADGALGERPPARAR
ncbi:MAG: PadR family transcriptional regulator [Pseudomonadales bacterium]|jgi:DNA-binding PadR family transcriptional regulator|nr:PadR family transcriptional regulator [Pseudomonadales bacterium]